MYLGRSQRTTQPVQVRDYHESAMMFSPFWIYSYILYMMLNVTSPWQADRVEILTWPLKLENVKHCFGLALNSHIHQDVSKSLEDTSKLQPRDVEKVENA